MPLALLQSQYDALEEPAAEERAWVLSIERPVEALVDEVAARLS